MTLCIPDDSFLRNTGSEAYSGAPAGNQSPIQGVQVFMRVAGVYNV